MCRHQNPPYAPQITMWLLSHAHVWIIWTRCVSKTLNLFIHINVYIVCPTARAIMLSHKPETTYNSRRHRGKSRPFYHSIKRETNWFVSKVGDQVTFLIAQSSESPSDTGSTKKNQPKQNRVLHLCLILPIKFYTFCPTKIITLPELGFSSRLFQWPSYFQIWFYSLKYLPRPMIFLIKKKKTRKVSSNTSSLLLIHFWKQLKASPDQHF